MATSTLNTIYNDTILGFHNFTADLSYFAVNNAFNSTFKEDGWNLPTWFTYTMTSVNCFLLIIGIFGNFSILLVVMRSSDRLNPYNLLVIALAISDMLAITTKSVFQLTLLEIVNIDVTVVTDIWCKIFLSIRQSVANISLSIIVLICIERFLVVVFPLKFKLVSIRRVRKVTIIALCICMVIDVIAGVLIAALYSHVNGGRCRINVISKRSALYPPFGAMILYSVTIIIPIIVVLTLTPIIIYKLYQQRAAKARLMNKERSSEMFQRSVMLISVVIAYIVLFGIPITFYLAFDLNGYDTDTENTTIVQICILTCFLVNHSTNFLVYGISNAKFRKQLLSQFGCLCRREHIATEEYHGIPEIDIGRNTDI